MNLIEEIIRPAQSNKALQENNFPSAKEDIKRAQFARGKYNNSEFELAFTDNEFMLRKELRPVRSQLELLKPDMIQDEMDVKSTVVVFGSARFIDKETAQQELENIEALLKTDPDNTLLRKTQRTAKRTLANSYFYEEARKLGALIADYSTAQPENELVVVTGGGPGIMEAANRGAYEMEGRSMGLNIVLPFEQAPNPYITPDLCFQFHYFALRKMHFLMRAKALITFPGGYGTLDELFETLTLIQTGKVKRVPIILFNHKFWTHLIDFDMLVEHGNISEDDVNLFQYAETAEDAWNIIADFYNISV